MVLLTFLLACGVTESPEAVSAEGVGEEESLLPPVVVDGVTMDGCKIENGTIDCRWPVTQRRCP
jgi:hypothetical protein